MLVRWFFVCISVSDGCQQVEDYDRWLAVCERLWQVVVSVWRAIAVMSWGKRRRKRRKRRS